jgi:acyl-CoA reductase-like NAD-dependent aldehyde dehydrogenase
MTTDIKTAVDTLRRAQDPWAAQSISQRLKYIKKIRGLVSSDSDRIARAVAEEAGKTPLEALTQEILPFLDTCLFLERRAETILADQPVEFQSRLFFAAKKTNDITRAPYGVIGILGTWNYAFFLNLTQALFAVTAGNAVFLKFSELSPRVAALSAQLLAEAGFPDGLIHVSCGGADEGRALTAAGCDKYILTGSRGAGRAVLGSLAQTLKPAIVELSGSDAYLIFADADWKLAVRSLVWAAFQYSGQTCVAPRRVIVLQKDRDKFLKIFRETVAAAKDFIAIQGRLRTPAFAIDETRKIQALEASGAQLLWKAGMPAGAGMVAPQLWGGVTPEAAGETDWMSPVLMLITAEDEVSMVSAARATPLGLGASVWTQSRSRAAQVSRSIRAGQVWVNDTLFTVALGEAPFGGFGASGFGKTRGAEGLLEMTESRLVSSDFRRLRVNVHLPPYPANSYDIIQSIQKIWFGVRASDKVQAVAGLMRACMPNDSAKKK